VSLNKLLDDTLEMFNERFNHTISVKRNFRDSMPRILDLGLQYIFTNIIKNALDAMPEEGALTVSTDILDAQIEIRIKDTGTGMSPEIASRIFEPFFTTKSIDKGTGLGLAICREIINKYEGDIKVNSEAGLGSEFVITIPSKYFENE
jgi:signal transduction histidine kinase